MQSPRPKELQKFHELLVENAPDGYRPYYFRCRSGSKAPDTSFGSWKADRARMSIDEALEWMQGGGNVGIAGRGECPDCDGENGDCQRCGGDGDISDALVNVDIDDEDETTPDDLKPTLIARSRSRTGSHAWYFEADGADIPNIPTDDAGEVRANWQYVVAPGSYVETDPDTVPGGEREDAGYYTVERAAPVTSIRFPELPDVFVDHHTQTQQNDKDAEVGYQFPDGESEADDHDRDGASALFDIDASEVVRAEGGDTKTDERWSAIFHGSETDANMSMSSRGLVQCWRHNVTHNALQALVVLSGYSGGCEDVGTGHKNSNAGDSCIKSEDGAHIWEAWKYAKQNGYIPDDDPVPYDALRHLCVDRDLCAVSEVPAKDSDDTLPAHAYDAALATIENNDGLTTGRKQTTEIDGSGSTKPKPTPPASGPSDAEGESDGDDWEHIRMSYADEHIDYARQAAANALESQTAFMWVLDSEILWRYDDTHGYYVPKGEAYIHRVLEDELSQHYSISEKSEVVDRIKARNQVDREELNAKGFEKKLLCVGDGVVDLANGELLDHAPKYKFTRGLEYNYEAEADTDAIVEFLDEITKREEDWQTLVDHLAHGLMPGHPYRAFVMTYGPGGNGKTQLGELLRGFVGADNAAAVELQDLTGDDDFATGALPSAFINIGDDVGVSEIRDTSTLKTASGGGTLRANEKHEKKFDFTNEAAMFFSANEPPRIKEGKQSIDDRLYPIEMPYRFVDDPDPDDEFQKPKTPGIADKLLNDQGAMRGLLQLVVEHAQRLIATGGRYSMPEGPSGRRDIYEAASDPIRRFAFDYLQSGDDHDQILKDDAFTVYASMCDEHDDRPARDDIFKGEMSKQSIIDLESGQTRQLTPGDSRVTAWKYVKFTPRAKRLMSDRLVERYFPGADDDPVEKTDDADEVEQERAAFGAEPIREAAQSLTGYVTVTAEIATTRRLGETESGIKAVVKDASGAIDLVAWDRDIIDTLEANEGGCVAVQNAEVTEYDGAHQLTTVGGLTDIQSIQDGVGYTEVDVPEDATDETSDQAALDVVSGSPEEWAQAEKRVLEELRTESGGFTVPELAGRLGESPEEIQSAVDNLSGQGRVVVYGDDVELNN